MILRFGSRIPHPPSPPFTISKVIRDQKGGLAKHAKFLLMREGSAILCAKIKDKKCVPIGAGSEFHYSATPRIAILKVQDKAKHFMLASSEGKDVCGIAFGMQEGPGKRGPRSVEVKF
jgi:hypothetical protein